MTIPSATGEADDSHTLLVGIQTSTATMQNNLAVSYKVKNALNIPSSNSTPRYLPK